MTLDDLVTPALLVDRAAVTRNCRRMSARAAELGVRLRPHLKTAKSADVARLATDGNFGGITVSTVAEARYFAGHGFTDILYAVGAHPSKLAALAALQASGATITLILSDIESVAPLADTAAALEQIFDVLIEIDTGGARAGVLPDEARLLDIARAVTNTSALRLEGVLTHAGQSYRAASIAAITDVAEVERAGAVRAAERLRAAGFAAPTVSVGSTPTALHARHLDGVTELRAGVYTLFDLDQLERQMCGLEDIAVSVLTSVIGHNHHTGRILVDAGALALSKDLSAAHRDADIGYGLVAEPDRQMLLTGLHVSDAYQEHGCLPVRSTADFARAPIGSRVRILPNHACMTAAPYSLFHVTDGGTEIVATWDKAVGW